MPIDFKLEVYNFWRKLEGFEEVLKLKLNMEIAEDYWGGKYFVSYSF